MLELYFGRRQCTGLATALRGLHLVVAVAVGVAERLHSTDGGGDECDLCVGMWKVDGASITLAGTS